MTYAAAVFDALKSLVNNRCYPDTFAQPSGLLPNWPAIRVVFVPGQTYPSICGNADPETADQRVQIDGAAKTAVARDALSLAIQAAMNNFSPPAILQGTAETDYDSETKTYRVTLDYVIHGSSS